MAGPRLARAGGTARANTLAVLIGVAIGAYGAALITARTPTPPTAPARPTFRAPPAQTGYGRYLQLDHHPHLDEWAATMRALSRCGKAPLTPTDLALAYAFRLDCLNHDPAGVEP